MYAWYVDAPESTMDFSIYCMAEERKNLEMILKLLIIDTNEL